jgi:hypothetical protein
MRGSSVDETLNQKNDKHSFEYASFLTAIRHTRSLSHEERGRSTRRYFDATGEGALTSFPDVMVRTLGTCPNVPDYACEHIYDTPKCY